jgi:hypothetical protein
VASPADNHITAAKRYYEEGKHRKALRTLADARELALKSRDVDALREVRDLAEQIANRFGSRSGMRLAQYVGDDLLRAASHWGVVGAEQGSATSSTGEASPADERPSSGATPGSPTPTKSLEPLASAADIWARICVVAFVIAAILSVIGGIAVGAEASKETVQGVFGEEQRRDSGVFATWIAAGVLSAFFWVGLAVGLELLRKSAASLDKLVAMLAAKRTVRADAWDTRRPP